MDRRVERRFRRLDSRMLGEDVPAIIGKSEGQATVHQISSVCPARHGPTWRLLIHDVAR